MDVPWALLIVVSVDLPAPSLSLQSGAVVSWGQTVQMSCSIAKQHLGGTFTLQQRSGSFRNTKSTWRFGYSATFSIPQVDFIQEGSYYCQYQTRVSGRDFTSPWSNTVSLEVTVSLVQPNISVVAPDGGLFWGPQGPEVTRGHSLSILCSTEAQYPGGSFHLLLDASNSTRTQSALNHSASFYIPEIEHSHQGNYSCVYQVTVSSRTFNSTQSEPLTLTVRVQASLAPVVASGVVAGLLLLVASLCLVRRKCCRETSPTPHTSHTSRKNSSNHRSSNPYKSRGATAHCDEDGGIYMNTDVPTDEAHRAEDLDHEEEEDEEVYVNVAELRSHSVATARQGCEEDCIYEN
ncbi:leukocyte immunoglobulin-like receptor subfamily B member 4 [Engraulis encrasicolus]|uniref:leukocyte immunoglobulin-like receptor subfamily B member 4 n=1 Tax=Engraulis encrasicolus TaxID=184585 RepID=UPI002FD15E80